MKTALSSKTNKTGKLLLGLGTILIPAALWYLWRRLTGCDFFQSHPTISDELGYWRIMYSFSERGFDFGTCGGFINCEPEWGHFGCHGLAPFLAWGWYALSTTWKWASLVEANFILYAAAIVIFVLLVHDNIADMLLTAAVLLCFPHTFLYLCSSLIEIPCASAAIVCAGFYIRYRKTKKRGWLYAALAAVVYLTGLRFTHIFLGFPIFWELCDRKLSKKTAAVMAGYAAAALLLFWFYYKFISRYPDWLLSAMGNGGLADKLALLGKNISVNLKHYFTMEEHQVIEFYQRMLMLILGPALWIIAARKKDGGLCFSLGMAAFGTVAFNIVCYDIGYQKEFRMMGPILLFIVLVLVNEKERTCLLKGVMAAAAALGLVIAVTQVRGYGERQEYNMFFMLNRYNEIQDMSTEIGGYFDEEAASVAIRANESFETVVFIPPQIGIQWVFSSDELKDSQTKYIISIDEDSIIPDNYELLGEPANMYRIYKKTDNGK